MEEAATQRALTAGPPTMTFGASAAKGVGDQKLAAMLARQRDKHANAHASALAATVEEDTEEQEPPEMVEASDPRSDQLPTGTIASETAQRPLTAGPPTMTFGSSAAKGVGDQKLAAMLARQRDKHAKAHASAMAATEEPEPPEMVEVSDPRSGQPPTGTMVAQGAEPLSGLPLTTTTDAVDSSCKLSSESAEASGGHPSTQSSSGQDLIAAVKVSDAASSSSDSMTLEPTEETALGDSTQDDSLEEVFYPLAELVDPKLWRCKPDVVERPHEREQFLAPDVFKVVFGMAKDDFAKLPMWRQSDLKKKHQLF